MPSPTVLKAARPAMMPTAMKRRDTMPQTTPQQTEDPPYRRAKTEASDSLTCGRTWFAGVRE